MSLLSACAVCLECICVCVWGGDVMLMYIRSHAAWRGNWSIRKVVVDLSWKLHVGCKLKWFSPVNVPALPVGTQGCGLHERSGSWGHSRWHFLPRQTPSLSHFNTIQPHCQCCNFKALMGLEQVKWIWRKLPTANQSEPGAVMLPWSQSFACGSSGRDRGSRRGSLTKPRAENAVGLKLYPG